MTSTPKPNRSPLTEAEYQTLRQLEDDIAALKAGRAPVAEIGRKVAELKRGGLWRRPVWLKIDDLLHARTVKTWEDYCTVYLCYTRRYCDQVIRLAGETTGPQMPSGLRKRAQIRVDGPEMPNNPQYPETTAFRLSTTEKDSLPIAAAAAGFACVSDMLRAFVGEGMRARGFSWT